MSDIRTSALGGIPFGVNSGRPSNPQPGQPYFNGQENRLEVYTQNGAWQNIVAETPSVVSYTGSILETNAENTLILSGNNFATGAQAYLIGNDGTEYQAVVITVNSVVQITATFGQISASKEPYGIKVVNPSNLYGLLPNAVGVNDTPVWNTASGSLGTLNELASFTTTLSATDEEGTPLVYSSPNLPSWLSLNSSSGALSGITPSVSSPTIYNFNVNVSDGLNTSSRSFNVTVNDTVLIAEILLVGGGGGGGSQVGGGGGAGGLLYSSEYGLNKSSTYSVTIGSGGAGGPTQQSSSRPGSYGGNSVFGTLTAFGGGGGGAHGSGVPASGADGYDTEDGRPGGSGGGGGSNGSGASNGAGGATTQTTQSGVTGYGFAGGTGYGGSWAGGGGGGAGSVGSNATPSVGANGGSGRQYSITGSAQWYAGGGGGCGDGSSGYGTGGSGIGGNGYDNRSGINTNQYTTNGAANTGSGGGGSRDAGPGGSGGSGVLVIAYPDTAPALTIGAGLTYDTPTRSGYRVYRITGGSGNITT